MKICVVAAIVTALGTATLGSCNPTTPKFAFTHAERRGRLDANGLRFVLMPDASTQLVEVDVRYEVGAREDPPGKAGLAHLVEHLMFNLRPDGPQAPPLMQGINDLTTAFNAFTNWDTTHYMNTARMEHLDAVLKIEAMRMFYGCQTLSPAEFLREREVVRNEIRERSGTAEGQIPQLVLSSVYPKGHAYERMIGGDDAQLTTITLDDACKFIKDYYVPARATVIIAGGIEVDPTVALIKKWFGKLEQRPGAPRTAVQPLQLASARTEFELDVERPSVHLAWALPPGNTLEGEAARFGITSAWSRIARQNAEYEFAYSVDGALLGGKLAPIFLLSIELRGMDKLDEAIEFAASAARQAYRGFDQGTDEQIEEIQNQQKAAFIQEMEPLAARTTVVGELVQFSPDFNFDGDGLYLFHELEKIGKFDGARVAKVVKTSFDPDKVRVVVIKPNKAGLKGDARAKVTFQTQSHDQLTVPDVDPAEARQPVKLAGELKSLVGARRVTLGNGMTIVMLPLKSMPLISTRLVFKHAGDARLPENPLVPGLAASYLQLPRDAEVFARTGVAPACETTPDATVCLSSGINIYLEVMLKGLERLITAGTYDPEAIERWQKTMRGQLGTKSAQQRLELNRQVLTALYGAQHPYTKTGLVTPEAIGKVSKDRLDEFRRGHLTAGNATLVIVGDFDPAQAERLARASFGGWDQGTVAPPVDRQTAPRTGPVHVGVIGKDDPQLAIQLAYPAPAGVDGQEGARQVLAEMIQIRVADVRFTLGTTYGVRVGRSARTGPSAYSIAGTVDAERAGESLRAIRDNIAQLRKGGASFDVDFVRARRKVIARLLGESTVTAELAARLGFIAQFGLDEKFFNTMLQQVAIVSVAQLQALVDKELAADREILVVLGDRPHLERAFKEAGLAARLVEPVYR